MQVVIPGANVPTSLLEVHVEQVRAFYGTALNFF